MNKYLNTYSHITMTKDQLLALLSNETAQFNDVINFIEENYEFTAVAFTVGNQANQQGTNLGSCKIFALSQDLKLTATETLQCFGDFYRKDVLENPTADDHQNIRNFMSCGFSGVSFNGVALVANAG